MIVRLDEIAEVVRGVTFSKAEGTTDPVEGRLPVVRAGSIQQTLLLDEGQIWVPSEKIKANQLIRKNDIIMCTSSGSSNLVGKCAKSDKNWEGSFGAFCAGIRPDTNKCDPPYLYHFLCSPKFRNWTKSSSGANIKNIRASELAAFKINLPPVEEQKRIAAILDKVDAIRCKRQQAIDLADQFLCSVFLDMFGDPVTNPKGWELLSLEAVGVVQGGLQVTKKRSDYPIELPYLRVANVYRDLLNLDEVKLMRITDAEADRIKLQKGDILIVEGHGNPAEIGRCAVWDGSIPGCIHQNHLIRFRCDQTKVLPEFLSRFINSEGGRRQMMAAGNTTSGLNTISTRIVKETTIICPPLELQEEYLSSVHKVQSKYQRLKKSLEKLENLIQSLSQQAFKSGPTQSKVA